MWTFDVAGAAASLSPTTGELMDVVGGQLGDHALVDDLRLAPGPVGGRVPHLLERTQERLAAGATAATHAPAQRGQGREDRDQDQPGRHGSDEPTHGPSVPSHPAG